MQSHIETEGYREEMRTTVRLALWTLAWVATFALASFGPRHLWDSEQTMASWAAVAANLVAGTGWIVAHMRHLRALDELQRKIMLDALAVTLGVGWVGGFAYIVADTAGLLADAIDAAVLSVLLTVVYLAALAVGRIRYR